ncbi:MAG: histidinol dehydrogenase [Candidatus Bathycorpusculaceae bacterium]
MKSERTQIIKVLETSTALPKWINRDKTAFDDSQLKEQVKQIIDEVKAEGDKALIKFTKKFDKVDLLVNNLNVSDEEIERAYEKVTEEHISALEQAKVRLETVEKTLLENVNASIQIDGITIKFHTSPIESVGCYVPGGKAAYPSTVVMTAAPAKLAGVRRVIVCSPPAMDGTINPLTLVAADICKVNEFYKVGGAQAIAAMAYGTETIKPVKKIVGPGNKYVTMAKVLVSKDVAIDVPAGPSELLIIASEKANPRLLALDMCSQAEHGSDSIVGLLTTSRELAGKVIAELERLTCSVSRKETVTEALSKNGFVIICKNEDEMVEIANTFAPEHLEIITKNAEKLAERISTAGLVLIGAYSTAALSDYFCGTNHVLPTSSFGKLYSGLSVLDFIRRIPIVKCSKKGVIKAAKYVKVLAVAEGLENHYNAVEARI